MYHSDIPHFTGELTDDLYALPVKKSTAEPPAAPAAAGDQPALPTGWERHEGACAGLVREGTGGGGDGKLLL